MSCYSVSPSGRVAALDAREGTLLWETLPRAELVSVGVVKAEALVNEGALIATTPDGGLFSLDPAHPDRKPASG